MAQVVVSDFPPGVHERTRENRVDRHAVTIGVRVGQLETRLAVSAIRIEDPEVWPFCQHDSRVPLKRYENAVTVVAGH